jgi:hypothetical protein
MGVFERSHFGILVSSWEDSNIHSLAKIHVLFRNANEVEDSRSKCQEKGDPGILSFKFRSNPFLLSSFRAYFVDQASISAST